MPTGKIERETTQGRADVGDAPIAETLGTLAHKVLSSSRHAESRELARATGERTTTSPEVVVRLDPDDAYDVVLVILPKHRIAEVLPVLAANDRTPSVMFFGNNAAGPDAMIDAIGRDRVLLGFPGAAAAPQ